MYRGLTERSLEASRPAVTRAGGIFIPCIIPCIRSDVNRRKSLRRLSIPDWARTSSLRLRRPTLYPIELRGLISNLPYAIRSYDN